MVGGEGKFVGLLHIPFLLYIEMPIPLGLLVVVVLVLLELVQLVHILHTIVILLVYRQVARDIIGLRDAFQLNP